VRAALLAQSRARRAGSGGTPGAATFIASLDHADGPRVRLIRMTGPGCEACRTSRGLLKRALHQPLLCPWVIPRHAGGVRPLSWAYVSRGLAVASAPHGSYLLSV